MDGFQDNAFIKSSGKLSLKLVKFQEQLLSLTIVKSDNIIFIDCNRHSGTTQAIIDDITIVKIFENI